MSYLLAIDAGTGSVRAVLFDLLGNEVAMSQSEWTHKSVEGVQNSMGFDYEKNWLLTCRCIQEATANVDRDEILALSSTSMREGIVLYDKDGNELWGVANVDARASKQVRELKESFKGIEEEFYAKSGQTFALGALPRLLWVKENEPEIYEKTASISMISDWVLAKLSGVIASEPSNASTTGVFDLSTRTWDVSMASKVGIKDDIFGEIFESGEVIGSVSQSASEQTLLSTKTKVVMGGGDVQLGSAGLGVVELNQSAILGGTFWQQIVNIDHKVKPPQDMGLRVNSHVIHGQNQAEGITFFSGLIMRWFRDAFCDLEKLEAKKEGIDVYTYLENMASKVPVGSHGIMPIFSDAMKYGKWYHAAPSFINLSIDATTCNKASMFRSLQENAAIVSDINLRNISKFSGVHVEEIVFAGGGSKGHLWSQILCDVVGVPLKIPHVKEATALGCAMAAGVGAGVYESIESAAASLVKWDKHYEPNTQNHAKYRDIEASWQQVYNEQLKLVDNNLTTSMWKAPGV